MESHVATHPQVLTADDVLDLPDPDGGIGWEFVDGQPVPVTSASLTHAGLIVEVAAHLLNHVREHGLPGKVFSDAGVVLGLRRDPERVRGPDVMYVERSKLEGHDPDLFVKRRRKRVEAIQSDSRRLASMMFVRSRALAGVRNRLVRLYSIESLAKQIARAFDQPI